MLVINMMQKELDRFVSQLTTEEIVYLLYKNYTIHKIYSKK
jgi:hypothetical protein